MKRTAEDFSHLLILIFRQKRIVFVLVWRKESGTSSRHQCFQITNNFVIFWHSKWNALVFFFLGVGEGVMLKRSIAFWKTENNRCWHVDVASTRFLGRKVPENRTVKGEKNMIKVGKKTDIFIGQPWPLFYFSFAVVEVCSGCLVMVKLRGCHVTSWLPKKRQSFCTKVTIL